MIQESDKDFLIELLRRSMIVITPWKLRNDYRHGTEQKYVDGWNNCVKEIIKTRKRYLAHMNKEFPPAKKTKKNLEK